MNKNVAKILTKDLVHELGLEKIVVITADMLDGYTRIGVEAFTGCLNLEVIEIPNTITSIRDGAFLGCSGLTSVTIPNSVTSIGYGILSSCSGLTSIIVESGNTFYDSRNNCNAIIETATNTLIAGCQSTIIPNSVENIADYAFWGCNSLTYMLIPNNIASIGYGVFSGCSCLNSVSIGGIEYKPQTVTNDKCKAYKAFNADMKCRGFQYKKGETYELNGEPKLCEKGFHACLNLADVFNYYYGNLGEDIVVHEVELEGVSDKHYMDDSNIVAKKITIGKRIL